MPFLDKAALAERLRRDATNSSHFVWLLTDLKVYETKNRWVFAYQRVGRITIVALEPLVPGAPVDFPPETDEDFTTAWSDFCAAADVSTAMFVSIYRPFVNLLRRANFTSLKVGQEPWVNLDDCIPSGNAGKGVRAARNQAIRAGVTVEQWTGRDIVSDPEKLAAITSILHEWRSARLIELQGFLDTLDPIAFSGERRYFVARSNKRIEAYLVASPIDGINGFFLEDLAARKHAPNGCGELLTLEAMVALRDAGKTKVSLGVVPMNGLGSDQKDTLPTRLRTVLRGVSRVFRYFYKSDGLEIYRRRFKPHQWTAVHLAVNSHRSRDWLVAIIAMLRAFRPKFCPSFAWLGRVIERPVRRYPLTVFVATLSTGIFYFVNRGGPLPESVLSRFGFLGKAPFAEWPLRSLVSDVLYFDLHHLLLWGGGLVLVLRWAERKHSFTFLAGFFVLCSLFDDIVNYWMVIMPFQYYQPRIFQRLISYKDVGSSLQLMSLLGLQLRQLRIFREPLFAGLSLALVLLFLFPAGRIDHYVVNLNHFLFFTIGYLVGVVREEWERRQSRGTARQKPPVAACVRGAKPLKT